MRRKRQLRHGSFSIVILVVFIAIFAGLGAYKLFVSHAISDTANLWIDTNGGTCTRQSTPSAYNDSAACASLDAAYQSASPGDSILIQTGNYGNQTIPYSSAKALNSTCRWGGQFVSGSVSSNTFDNVPQNLTGCIKFSPATGASVTLGAVDLNVPYVYLQGLTFSEIDVQNNKQPGTNGYCDIPDHYTDIIVKDGSSHSFFLKGVQYISFVNTVFDSQQAVSSTLSQCNQSSQPYDSGHVLFDGVTVKDTFWTASGQHVEGIHIWDFDQLTIQNSKFLNNAQFNISLQGDSGNENHLLLQNNVFDSTCSHQDYSSTGGCSHNPYNGGPPITSGCANPWQQQHWLIRFNAFPPDSRMTFQTISPNVGCAADQWEIANFGLGESSGFVCSSDTSNGPGGVGVHFLYNVWTVAPSCDTGNSYSNNPSSLYTDPANYDYSQKAGSLSIDFLSTSSIPSFPATDILGKSRPQNIKLDAGAYEASGTSGTPTPGDCNADSHVDITDLSILLSHFNTSYTACDFNADSTVNILDLSILLSHFGT